MNFRNAILSFCLTLLVGACFVFEASAQNNKTNAPQFAEDFHSYSNPQEARVTHVALDWNVLFDQKILRGTAILTVERMPPITTRLGNLILDTRDLKIEKVETSSGGANFYETQFKLGAADKILGAPLNVTLPSGTKYVRVTYETSPQASGLQWLAPEQTAGKKSPYMFSQAQAIHARSFVPLQDSPQARVTYSARVRTPRGLLAVMSADGNSRNNRLRNGDYSFEMTNPIPPYLIAIAVGDLQFKSLGARSGVYTEPSMLAKSAFELTDTEKMIQATEKIYGAYRWNRYDLLVLPPSFPFGGMENPMLTFATPTILAGDKSLVSLVAHELAHSWSGNLVTNATWRDFWLNEGFTTYLERRIIEAVYGSPRREMEAKLGRASLEDELKGTAAPDQILHVNLKGRDPDEGFTGIPYEKGALFLRYLEEKFGRTRFDPFVRGYFDRYAFQSITTEIFVDYLQKNLLNKYPGIVALSDVEEWVEKTGLPANAPQPQSDAFAKVEIAARDFSSGKLAARNIQTKNWTTQEWLHFLKTLPENLGANRMTELDARFKLTRSGNAEIAFQWLLMAIKNDYAAANPRLEAFLVEVGRRKFVRPLFAELVKTEKGKTMATAIYAKARPGYHPITVATVDAIVGWQK